MTRLCLVLNAWRRHCGRHRLAHPAPGGNVLSAQRLAASLRSAPTTWPPGWPGGRTPCSTPGGVTAVGTVEGGEGKDETYACSTPGGVTAVGTCVLVHFDASVLCSTPGGVTAVGTSTWLWWMVLSVCAQRLAASLRSAQFRPALAPARVGVLNAWRRHCGRHVAALKFLHQIRSLCSTPGGVTAVGTAGHGRRGGGDELVLNAWRRHCGRHGSTSGPCSARPSRCSTPGGVTAVGTDGERTAGIPTTRVLNAWRRHCGRHRL